ncbi:TIGR02444 family protein [Synechococcus moorigangaii CMS01]|nr:TIGR02444 family protein [Synechococcus moorigangaii CMS01]
MQGSHGQGLWDFSVTLYAHAPVKAAALALQDAGLDVNIAFWIVWTTGQGRDPGPMLDDAVRVTANWHALATAPLRGVRDALKHVPPPVPAAPAQALRQQVLDAELAAENIAQALLEKLETVGLASSFSWPERALAGLELYAAHAGSSAPVIHFKEAIFSALEKG